MGIDLSFNIKPSEVKRFNTAQILLHFVNLMSPEKFTMLEPVAQAKLVAIGNDLAQIGKDLHNPIPRVLEILRAHIGTPVKGSKGVDILGRLTSFENNYLPNLNIQHEELKSAQKGFSKVYSQLFHESSLDLTRIKNLEAEITTFRAVKVQSFLDQEKDLMDKLTPIEDEAIKLGIPSASKNIHEEAAPATVAMPPAAPQNK